jgi:hypothetical protein
MSKAALKSGMACFRCNSLYSDAIIRWFAVLKVLLVHELNRRFRLRCLGLRDATIPSAQRVDLTFFYLLNNGT